MLMRVPLQSSKLALAAGIVAVAGALVLIGLRPLAANPVSTSIRDDGGDVLKADITAAIDGNPEVNVKVNGQPVSLDASGSATVKAGDATVNVSDTGQSTNITSRTTQTTSPDGSINISVSANQSTGHSSSSTSYQQSGSNHTNSSSSVHVFSNGTGQVNVQTNP